MSKSVSGKARKKLAAKPMVQRIEAPDPLSPENIRQMALRLGIPLAAVWTIGGCIAGISQSRTAITIALVIPAILTVGILGIVVWAVRQARKAKGVAGILQGVETADDRKAALEKIEQNYGKKDP